MIKNQDNTNILQYIEFYQNDGMDNNNQLNHTMFNTPVNIIY